ncbi:MAG: hypothetical protein ACK4FL_03645 [Microgenomates group bacterium]
MKKLPLFYLIILLVVIGLGYYFFNGKKQEKVSENKVQKNTQEKKETVVEKIKDLVAQNVSLKCTYQIDEAKITTYIKGKNKFRTTVETKQGVNESIFADNKIYSWDPKRKEGMVMSVDLIKNLQNTSTKVEDPEKQIEEMERLKATCIRENFSDNVFTPPTDVKFQDFDKLQQMMQ